MIATTSFMVRPTFSLASAVADRWRRKSGIFSGKWHKKVAALSGNIPRCVLQALYRAWEGPSEYGLWRALRCPPPCVVLSSDCWGETNVQPIVVFCIERPAAGPLSRSPVSRHDRARRRQPADAGLVRGHGGLANGPR